MLSDADFNFIKRSIVKATVTEKHNLPVAEAN